MPKTGTPDRARAVDPGICRPVVRAVASKAMRRGAIPRRYASGDVNCPEQACSTRASRRTQRQPLTATHPG